MGRGIRLQIWEEQVWKEYNKKNLNASREEARLRELKKSGCRLKETK